MWLTQLHGQLSGDNSVSLRLSDPRAPTPGMAAPHLKSYHASMLENASVTFGPIWPSSAGQSDRSGPNGLRGTCVERPVCADRLRVRLDELKSPA